jgi:hypothetical protein
LAKEHFEHAKLEKEKEGLSGQIAKIQQQFEEAQQMIQNQQAEENKLRHIIDEADSEMMRQKKEYESIVQERVSIFILFYLNYKNTYLYILRISLVLNLFVEMMNYLFCMKKSKFKPLHSTKGKFSTASD